MKQRFWDIRFSSQNVEPYTNIHFELIILHIRYTIAIMSFDLLFCLFFFLHITTFHLQTNNFNEIFTIFLEHATTKNVVESENYQSNVPFTACCTPICNNFLLLQYFYNNLHLGNTIFSIFLLNLKIILSSPSYNVDAFFSKKITEYWEYYSFTY